MEAEGSCSQVSPTGPYPEPDAISLRSILIISSDVRLGLQSRLVSSGFPIKVLYAFFISPMRAICPANHTLLDFIIRIILGEWYKL
jgi:hypothetical protein